MNADGPSVAIWSFLIVAMLAMILLVGIIALLSFKSTRPLGVGLVLFFIGGGFLLTMGLFFVRASAVPQQAITYRYGDSATLAPRQASPEFHSQAHVTIHEQVTVPQPVISHETDAVPSSTGTPAGAAVETPPAEVVEPAASSDSDGEPAATPTAVETPAEAPTEPAPTEPAPTEPAPTEPAPPAEAVPAAQPAEVVPAEAVPVEAVPVEAAPAQAPPANPTPATIVAEKLTAAPPVRPAWVDAPPHREQQVYQFAVKSGLFVTEVECQGALEKAMQRAVDEYIDEYLEVGAAQLVRIEPRFVQQRIRRDTFSETVRASVGPMQQVHGLLVIDDSVRGVFQQRWRQAQVNARLWQVGTGSAVVLGLIGTLFGFLSWGQRSSAAAAIPHVVAEKSGAAVATHSRFWLHCAVVVAILIGVLAFLV